MTEIETIYGQLQQILGEKIEPAPDEWDRLSNVDFYIQVGEKFIGLQIKPISIEGGSVQLPQIFKEKTIQEETHRQFSEVFGGKVFYIYTIKNDGKKEIYNKEVIQVIKEEIERLKEA